MFEKSIIKEKKSCDIKREYLIEARAIITKKIEEMKKWNVQYAIKQLNRTRKLKGFYIQPMGI